MTESLGFSERPAPAVGSKCLWCRRAVDPLTGVVSKLDSTRGFCDEDHETAYGAWLDEDPLDRVFSDADDLDDLRSDPE